MAPSFDIASEDHYLICKACGTQFGVDESSGKDECRICDDPRQFVPPTGQAFTTLAKLKAEGFKNVWKPDPVEEGVTSIYTEPKIGIGQRCLLLQTPHGNVLWDMICFLDQETIDKINALGGLKAIVISHPHYYTTYTVWARVFNCPIYTSVEDRFWLHRLDVNEGVNRAFLTENIKEIVPGVTMIKCGGHFDGSVVLHWKGILFIADTILTVPSGMNPEQKSDEVASYSFMWSIPNWIPMNPEMILNIWHALKPYEFHTTFGAFAGIDVRGGAELKKRLLQSMKIAIRHMGYEGHSIEQESI